MPNPNPFLRSPLADLADDTNAEVIQPAQQQAPLDTEIPKVQAAPITQRVPTVSTPRVASRPQSLIPPAELNDVFEASAQAYGVPVNVLMALAQQESGYNPKSINKTSGAKGIMNYMDATASSLGIDPYDPNQAIPAAAKQLRDQLDLGHSMDDAIRHHFAGPDRKLWGAGTAAYGNEVLGKAGKIGSELYGPAVAAETPAGAAPKPYGSDLDPNKLSTSMNKADYLADFMKVNPTASADAQKYAMDQYDKAAAARTKAGGSAVQDKFAEMQSPDAAFTAKLNAKLQAGNKGIAQVVPGRQSQVQPVDNAEKPTPLQQAGNNVGRGIRNLQALGYGLGGLAADELGYDNKADQFLNRYVEVMDNNARDNPAEIGTYKKVKSASDASKYASEAILENLAMFLPALASGGVGAVIARKAAEKTVGGMVEAQIANGVSRAVAEKMAAQFVAKRVMIGSAAGAAPASVGMESGSIMGDIYKETGQKESNTALAFGIPAGLLDTLTPVLALRKIAGPAADAVAGGLIRRLGTEAGMQFISEAGTEGLQTILEEAAKAKVTGKDLLTPELIDQVIDAALKGGIGGSAMGMASQAVSETRGAVVNNPNQQIANAINDQAQNVDLGSTDAAVRASMDPNGATAIDPAQTRVTPAPQPTPAPAAPIQDAQQVVGPQPALQDQTEFAIPGEDGSMHTLNADGTIVETAPAPAGPLSAALGNAMVEHATNPQPIIEAPQPEPVQPAPEPQAPPAIEIYSVEQLQSRLKEVATSIKQTRTPELVAERKQVEKELAARRKEAIAASKPAEEPITRGPFDERADANRMMIRAAEAEGVAYEVVEKDGKFALQPLKESENDVPGRSDHGGPSNRPADRSGLDNGSGPESDANVQRDGRTDDAGRRSGIDGPDNAGSVATVDAQPALKEWERNPYSGYSFATPEAAEAFMVRKTVDRDQFESVQMGKAKWTVRPKSEGQAQAAQAEASFDTEMAAPGVAEIPASDSAVKAKTAAKAVRKPAAKKKVDKPAKQPKPEPVEEVPAPTNARDEALASLADKTTKELREIAASHKRIYMREGAATILQDRADATSSKRSQAMKTRMKRDAKIDTESDDMAKAIAKMGGINVESVQGRLRLAPEELSVKANVGNLSRRVFVKNGGMRIDQAGAAMAELGYVSKDENGKHDQSEWEELLSQVAGGEQIYTAEGMIAKAEEQRAIEMEELHAKSEAEMQEIEQYADSFEDWADSQEIAIPEGEDLYHDENDAPLISQKDINDFFSETGEAQDAGRTNQDNTEDQTRTGSEAGPDAAGSDFLQSQSREELAQKDARARDQAIADRDLADSQRDAFSLSAPPGSVTGEANEMSNSRQTGFDLNDLNDSSQLSADGPLMQAEPARRVMVLSELKRLQKLRERGAVPEAQIDASMNNLIAKIGERNEAKDEARLKDKERGPEWVEERLLRAKRKGELDADAVDFALWALRKSPSLAEGLAISVRAPNEAGSAGSYRSADRLMTLFKEGGNTGTAVHEILHHTERMMPRTVQDGISKAWQKAYTDAWTKADPKQRAALEKMIEASAGSKDAHKELVKSFSDGTLKYDQHYQLTNASEFWAVNATRIMAGRYDGVKGGWTAKAKQWLTEMGQKVKGLLGMKSDAPILKALDEVLNGEGKMVSRKMLLESAVEVRDQSESASHTFSKEIDAVNKAQKEYDAYDKRVREDSKNNIEPNADEYFATSGAVSDATDALEAKLVALPDDGFGLHAMTRDGRMLAVNESAQKEGYWQLTRFDKNGAPWSDTNYKTKKQAVSEFVNESDVSTITDSNDTELRDITDPNAQPDLTPPEQGVLRRLQAGIQNNMNRVVQVQDRIVKLIGGKIVESADYYGAETNRPGRIAARLEDAQDKMLQPMMERLAAAKHTPEQLQELLHAMHAEERNAAVAKINPKFDPNSSEYVADSFGSGMSPTQAREIMRKYRDADELHAIANTARDIAQATLDLKLAYGLMTPEQHKTLTDAYEHYVPLKGDGEFGPKNKRAMGHEARDEQIMGNIARDYAQAVTVGEKNLARQSLLQMVLRHPDDNLWTASVPPKGRYIAGTVFNVIRNGQTEAAFTNQAQVAAFLEGKGAEAHNYTVQTSAGEQVVEFTKTLQDNEVMVYVKGQSVRLQIHDETLARQLRPLGGDQMNVAMEALRSLNRHLSKVYTGYNPSFILRNTARDALTGTINMIGNQGSGIAAKAWWNYRKSAVALGLWARKKEIPAGRAGDYLREYRDQGGKVGASWMSDLEQQGKSLTEHYDNARGLIATARDTGASMRTANVAWNKTVGRLAHIIEVANTATENALRLSLYTAMREAGHSPAKAAQAAKTVTVDFDRKGSSTPALGAFYLFLNPAVQGTANLTKTLVKGENRYQAWAAVGALASLGYMLAAKGMDDDKDRWLGNAWEKRSKTFMYQAGNHQITIPVSQEYAPYFAFGTAIAEVSRGESKIGASARVLSSFIDAYFPLNGAFNAESDNHPIDFGTSLLPTILKPYAEIATNRNAFGSKVVPEGEFTKDRPDNLKMNRATKNSVYDKAAQAIANGGIMLGAGKYENDISKVSPEVLKLLWRTYTGGLGTFITDTTGAASMGAEDWSQMDSEDFPIIKDFVRPISVQPIQGRYMNLSKEARAAISEFNLAAKAGDGDEVNKIVGDAEKARFMGMTKLITYIGKASGQLADQTVDIAADKSLTGPQKRERLKEIDAQKEELYRTGISAFK